MTVTTTGTDKAGLLKDLKKLVVALEDDLRERSESVEEFRARLDREWREAKEEGRRTALSYPAWRDERVTQAAAAWVLGCVFVRFCEDNGMIDEPFLAGPGERLAEAEARHEAHFRTYPHHNNRDWLIEAFRHLASTNETAAGLFDERHNPLWGLTPGYETATELLMFWRRWGADGEIRYDFTDPEWNTRFLGDLYQDLSEHARKTYALLQTPEFVEEFILDLTLEPAVADDGQGFGLNPAWTGPDGKERRGLRTIDPACGSGHFLLGIFHRLLDKWRQAEPGTDDWTLVRRVLESVHGCDKNPFAASIARFRLLVAAMRAAGARRLADAPAFPINVAVGDSLLHGRDAMGIQTDLDTLFAESVVGREEGEAYAYATEDVWEYAKRVDLLGRGSYHVVVGNPPYITVKDKQENENYRRAYDTCAGTYALSVPFAQRMFELAVRGPGGRRGGGGFVGQITANSFMKREFGKKLIEVFFRNRVELSHVIDTSGAFIPGHGTPTVILVGRNRIPSPERTLRAVLGVRGEPAQPEDASQGAVWRAIVEQVGKPGSESEWVSAEDAAAAVFSTHPWSVTGGGAGALVEFLAAHGAPMEKRISKPIGRAIRAGADEAYMRPLRSTYTPQAGKRALRPLMAGEIVRDWWAAPDVAIWNPDSKAIHDEGLGEELWPWRATLAARRTFQGTMEDAGLEWWDYMQYTSSAYETPLSITFAFVATHNHFVLDRGGKVFNRSAPVIKLPEGASEDEHLELLGVLNSSAACFWLKQVSQGKGGSGLGRGLQDEEWEERYEFTGTKLQEFPLPARAPLHLGRVLDAQTQKLAPLEPSSVVATDAPTRRALQDAEAEHSALRRRMIALQEELDWQVYGLYGLLSDAETARTTTPSPDPDTIPEAKLGERAFEIVLARKAEAGEVDTAWFRRHGSTPVTEIPTHWPDWYRNIVQARIDLITRRKDIALIERPECKRRWSADPWEKKERTALRNWLLDRCEDEDLWFEVRDGLRRPRTLTVNNLADQLGSDPDFTAVAALYAADHLKKPDLPLAQILSEVITDEHVPYLAAMRYKDSGLRTRREWEKVWEKQREEDRTGQRLDIDPPTKYKSSDFLRPSYWSHRGKLDVPKERFISYPEAGPDSDSTLMLGWAGWDRKDQALALTQLIDTRVRSDAWGAERLVPLLAGLQEAMPWVRQWYSAYDDEWEGSPAEDLEAEFQRYLRTHGVSEAQMRDWRPVRKTRGRKSAQRRETTEQPALDDE
ncbi:BREX-2 system adenine-specific DNA-methyltransferase PglX [Streptomyces angustmyceticus]|uniref:BREX-2 system adenine-specific DNA-methyltransferase PglX n=1 Tax=Streptomyces angustmyceticus TaxID=285578 RepID=UPI0021AEF1BC|nr:BREX-2 system adenine-specific DNA-methyltransferase PglX [Streptomyces angustmyceticus]